MLLIGALLSIDKTPNYRASHAKQMFLGRRYRAIHADDEQLVAFRWRCAATLRKLNLINLFRSSTSGGSGA